MAIRENYENQLEQRRLAQVGKDSEDAKRIDAHANIVADRRDADYMRGMQEQEMQNQAMNQQMNGAYNQGANDGLMMSQAAMQQAQAPQVDAKQIYADAMGAMEQMGPDGPSKVKQQLNSMRQDPNYGPAVIDEVEGMLTQRFAGNQPSGSMEQQIAVPQVQNTGTNTDMLVSNVSQNSPASNSAAGIMEAMRNEEAQKIAQAQAMAEQEQQMRQQQGLGLA